MISLSGLNPQQRQAAETVEGPVLILAGAGSGKTRTLTYRIAHMVDNLEIPPSQILGVSFTNKAAKEMRERVHSLLGRRKSKGVTLSTFHSLGVKILKSEITKLGYHRNFSIYDTTDQMSIVREALKLYKADKNFDRKIVLSKIGYLKNRGISAEDFANTRHFNGDDPYDIATEYVYHFYQDKLRFYNAIDFDDILFLVVKLFKEFPDVARTWSEKFQYIMIDEYQDTNTLQFQLTLGLTLAHNNLCVVGDDDQSIYAFRGADVSNILGFEKNFPGAKVVKLEENYRSVMPVLSLANHVIKENKNRREKTLWSKKQSSNLPELWLTGDTDHEAQAVVEDILKHQSDGGHLGDIAILYRSNTQVPPLEDELRMSQIPYTIVGGQKLYERKEVKDLLAYLSVIHNPADQMATRRILNVPARGIGTATLNKFLEKSQETKLDLFETMRQHANLASGKFNSINEFTSLIDWSRTIFAERPLPEAIGLLVERIDFFSYIDKSYDNAKQAERRRNDIMFFIDSAERFLKYKGPKASLEDFVEKVLLQDSQDKRDEEDEEDDDVRKNEVTLMTLHSSKGLEFRQVYLIGMEEETLPHKKTVKEGEDIGEERRLCYVGITRAQDKLVMTYCKERQLFGKKTPRNPSRFVFTLMDKDLFIHKDVTSFGHLSVEEADA
ncbi:MAG: ATP-dependent DNA helicase Rep [Halobacteriovorax sp.]|nr:ATP-dependent DNA helicase Rep [Halobacteriovorax sp.]